MYKLKDNEDYIYAKCKKLSRWKKTKLIIRHSNTRPDIKTTLKDKEGRDLRCYRRANYSSCKKCKLINEINNTDTMSKYRTLKNKYKLKEHKKTDNIKLRRVLINIVSLAIGFLIGYFV